MEGLCLVGQGGGQGGFLVRSLVDGAGSYSVAHRAGLLPTELTGMWGLILLRSPRRGRGSPPSPRPPLSKGLGGPVQGVWRRVERRGGWPRHATGRGGCRPPIPRALGGGHWVEAGGRALSTTKGNALQSGACGGALHYAAVLVISHRGSTTS